MLVALGTIVLASGGLTQEEEPVIDTGKNVGFEYTLTLDDGTVVESNVGGDAALFVHGEGQILPALEDALSGLGVDDQKTVSLEADDAYGPVNPEAFREIPVAQIPEDARVVGTRLSTEGYDGPIRVHEVRDDSIVLDFNHPLTGQALTFDVRIVSVD
jgi:FKBP-type peptidyl-prolyl cis-trans isomerase 2